jgi:uncharacterized protein involved in exopolysaccharide biosynthesis
VKTEFPVSEKMYALLLRAYPPSHRERYAAAMMQLFRDQCRDACAKTGHFGLLKLWLRALPDLACNSLRERLAAMSERKTMNDKLANLSAYQNYSPGKTFMRVFVPVFLIVVIVSAMLTFIQPKMYVSESRLLVQTLVNKNASLQPSPYDPDLLQSQCEIIASDAVLGPVVEKMNLNKTLGGKYGDGEQVTPTQSLAKLRKRLLITPLRGSTILSIQVFSEDKNEAAAIANAISESYMNYRHELHEQFRRKLDSDLAKFEGIFNSSSSDAEKNEALKKIQSIQAAAYTMPGNIAATPIIDKAEPSIVPVRPNKPLNITIGVVGGILLASIIGAFVLAAKAIARRQTAMAGGA